MACQNYLTVQVYWPWSYLHAFCWIRPWKICFRVIGLDFERSCRWLWNAWCVGRCFSSGIEDQLLALVVAKERPNLDDAKNHLIVHSAKMKQELKAIEDKILMKLSSSQGSPVDDLDFIQTLEASKITSDEIKVCDNLQLVASVLIFSFLISCDWWELSIDPNVNIIFWNG